jgi:SAM-dependent methyltransferase
MLDSHTRFTRCVADYARYRPDYPSAVAAMLRDRCGLTEGHRIADLGSGTGLLSRLFLDAGCDVFGVEPNDAMRAAAEGELGHRAAFSSVSGSAEATGLDFGSVDFVVAGQAFHWFEPGAAAQEARRILRPGGWAILIWNSRPANGSAFDAAYQQLIRRFSMDGRTGGGGHDDPQLIAQFFAPGQFSLWHCDNAQELGFQGLQGRLLSASYVPPAGHPEHDAMLAALQRLFVEHQRDGSVRIEYQIRVYYGRLRSAQT